MHSRAGECADAVALARDPYRLHAAPDYELVTAAAVLAKGLVSVIAGLRAQRASRLVCSTAPAGRSEMSCVDGFFIQRLSRPINIVQ
jgi:hypothetical protein